MRNESVEVITRYYGGGKIEYSFDGGKTWLTKEMVNKRRSVVQLLETAKDETAKDKEIK